MTFMSVPRSRIEHDRIPLEILCGCLKAFPKFRKRLVVLKCRVPPKSPKTTGIHLNFTISSKFDVDSYNGAKGIVSAESCRANSGLGSSPLFLCYSDLGGGSASRFVASFEKPCHGMDLYSDRSVELYHCRHPSGQKNSVPSVTRVGNQRNRMKNRQQYRLPVQAN